MANVCTNCGHELRVDDKFCAECGTSVGGAASSQTQPERWEYCEIRCESKQKIMFVGNIWWMFRAEAIGPNGVYTVPTQEYKGDSWPGEGHSVPIETRKNTQVVSALVSELV